jgi:hypothetical protein
MHAPINKLIVTLEKKLYDSRTFDSGQTIFFDPSWQPEEYAMLKARVVSVAPDVINRFDYRGYKMCVEPGDEILIRYDVVFAYKDQPDRDTPVYKNLLFVFNEEMQKYEEVWLCDILQVFAIIKDGQYYMINGFVMLNQIIDKKADFTSRIIRPDNYNNIIMKDRAVIRAVNSKDLPVNVGDTVYINPHMVMEYQINLEKFYIIKEQYILGLQV